MLDHIRQDREAQPLEPSKPINTGRYGPFQVVLM